MAYLDYWDLCNHLFYKATPLNTHLNLWTCLSVVSILTVYDTISNICFGICFQRPATFFLGERETNFNPTFIRNAFGSETFFGSEACMKGTLNRTGIKRRQSLAALHGPDLAACLVSPWPPPAATIPNTLVSMWMFKSLCLCSEWKETDKQILRICWLDLTTNQCRVRTYASSSPSWKPAQGFRTVCSPVIFVPWNNLFSQHNLSVFLSYTMLKTFYPARSQSLLQC